MAGHEDWRARLLIIQIRGGARVYYRHITGPFVSRRTANILEHKITMKRETCSPVMPQRAEQSSTRVLGALIITAASSLIEN